MDGNQWITTVQTVVSPLPILIVSTSEKLYEIPLENADSVYANQSYKKLLREGTFIGLLRESADSIVYFLPENYKDEKILYDFSAHSINASSEELSSLAINAVAQEKNPEIIETNLGVVIGGYMELAFNDSENFEEELSLLLQDKTVSAVFSRSGLN